MKKVFILAMLFLLVFAMVVPAFATEGDGTEAVGGGTATFPTEGVPEFTNPPAESTSPAPSQSPVVNPVNPGSDPSPTHSHYFGVDQSAEDLIGITENGIVTTDQVGNWFNRKGSELIDIIKIAAQVVLVIVLIVSVVCIAVGAIGNKRLMVGGFIAFIASAVGFTVITCWEQILQVISLWLRS